ncbi:hypothetical protein [Kibdelosporangium aridum]|uniref:hypothetical protein n=1 Tax=Kibdelosporangium aridum TaxID=2030 RepID=UPI001F477819|nr:hypothetical protein [Kibdelosporangium aridum]
MELGESVLLYPAAEALTPLIIMAATAAMMNIFDIICLMSFSSHSREGSKICLLFFRVALGCVR